MEYNQQVGQPTQQMPVVAPATVSYVKEDVVVIPEVIPAVIVNLREVQAWQVYGTKARDAQKPFIEVTLENNEYKVQVKINIAAYPKGNIPNSSNLGKVIMMYGGLFVQQVINIKRGDKGFWRVDMGENNGKVSERDEKV